MASGAITSWQIFNRRGKNGSSDRFFFPLVSKITADGHCGHEIKRRLLLERKAMSNLHKVTKYLKSKGITLLTKDCIIKAMVLPVVMYRLKSWTIKKAECRRIDAF